MKNYTSNEDFKKALNRDIDWFKKALSDSYGNLDLYLKAKIEVGEVVLIKKTLTKGIVRSFSLEVESDKVMVENSNRVINLIIVTIAGDMRVKLDDIVIYSDTARLLYAKQVETTHYTPKKDNSDDGIPF